VTLVVRMLAYFCWGW